MISYGKPLTLAMLILFLYSPASHAAVNSEKAIRAIVGEAENQDFLGMVAVGEAIRNRGTLKGVCGLTSPRPKKASKAVWTMARKAWLMSADTNIVRGADHWESTDFPKPYWAKGAHVEAHIGKHIFYSGVRR